MASRESRKARRKRVLIAAAANVPRAVSAHDAEMKEVKAKVALMKKDRKKLPTTGGKNERQAANKAIRQLVEDTSLRHLGELRAAGLATPSDTVDAWKAKNKDMSMD